MTSEKKALLKDFVERFSHYPKLRLKDFELDCVKYTEFCEYQPGIAEQYIQRTMQALNTQYNRPEHNIFYTKEHRLIRFFVYIVLTKKEKTPMVLLPKHIQSLLKSLSEEMQARCEDSLHLFLDAIKELGQEGSELRKNNSPGTLLNTNFMAHPMVPRGYYDSKHNGILYVIDGVTGERIRKDQSILTTEGFFTVQENGFKVLETARKESMIKLLRGDQSQAIVFKNKFIQDSSTGLYVPIDPALFKIKLSSRRIAQVFCEMYLSWCHEQGILVMPENTDELVADFPRLKEYMQTWHLHHSTVVANQYVGLYFPSSQQAKESSILVPCTSPFFAGMVIEDGDYLGSETLRANDVGRKPLISLSAAMGVVFNPDTIGTGRAILPIDIEGFPFSFYLQVLATTAVTHNRETKNSYGELLAHNARVNEYKLSFLMTPQEKKVFDQYDQEHKAESKAWTQKLKEANLAKKTFNDTKPVKPSSKEPIYLGLELEVVMKGPHQSTQGLAKYVQDMAKSSFGNHIISKHDGSIGNYGLEIVTIPATLAYHKQFFDEHFFGLPNMFHKRIMVKESCGIHVHISKNAMTALDLGKFMSFINSAKNASFINAFAGRSENRYCTRSKTPGLNAKGVDISARAAVNACKLVPIGAGKMKNTGLSFSRLESASHYDAVNIQNAHTIELRIFKSSSDRNRILRILEFCESLVKFVRGHSTQQMTVYDYVEFILKNERTKAKDYHNVVRWLASKNYIGHTTKHGKDPKTGQDRARLIHIYSENKVPFPDTLFHNNKENYRDYYNSKTKKEA